MTATLLNCFLKNEYLMADFISSYENESMRNQERQSIFLKTESIIKF